MMFVHSILIGKRLNNNGLYLKEVCNRGAASSLLKLDGGWQAMPSITKFLDIVDLYVVHSHLRMWAALKKAVFFQKKKIKLKTF